MFLLLLFLLVLFVAGTGLNPVHSCYYSFGSYYYYYYYYYASFLIGSPSFIMYVRSPDLGAKQIAVNVLYLYKPGYTDSQPMESVSITPHTTINSVCMSIHMCMCVYVCNLLVPLLLLLHASLPVPLLLLLHASLPVPSLALLVLLHGLQIFE
eukprot:GHVU01228964.1.p1 GENE.GHVU01228964.1~~GHVU01228964.1.p1  ORF type:complete len:153 (-),score=14.90 GHVU01228964.1:1366-1824(-)